MGEPVKFWRRRKKPITIGSLRDTGQRLAIYCGACKTMSYLSPDDTMLLPNVELAAMEKFYPCPECGHSNGESGQKLTIRPEAH